MVQMNARETRIWNALAICVTLVTMAVPLVITYQQFELGGSPRKSVELDVNGPIDPFSDISTLGRGTQLSLRVGQEFYNNLLIWQVDLHNQSQAPIIPTDFVEPLRITVDPPWEIVAIGDHPLLGQIAAIHIDWKRLGPRTMEAERFLLNPGDHLWQTVYLTARIRDAERLADVMKNKRESSAPRVTARVVNLRGFTKPPDSLERLENTKQSMVFLSFRDVIVLLVVANLFFYWYLRSIENAGLAVFPSTRAFILAIALGILSYSTAEVVTYYLFGGNPIYERVFGRHLLDWRHQLQNWLILAVYIICVAYFYVRTRFRNAKRVEVARS